LIAILRLCDFIFLELIAILRLCDFIFFRIDCDFAIMRFYFLNFKSACVYGHSKLLHFLQITPKKLQITRRTPN